LFLGQSHATSKNEKEQAMPQDSGDHDAPPPARVLCRQPAAKPVPLPAGISPVRASAIRIGAKKWVNGTVIHYYFLNSPPQWQWIAEQEDVVRWAVGVWSRIGIGLSFVEVTDPTEAEIFIGCSQTDGSWSLVGTDNLDATLRDNGRTLNYGWDLTTDWGKATTLHELGHVVGFSHEHQSPNAGIVWNAQAVYAYFSGPPNNWDQATIDGNIIQKLDPAVVQGSTWDPTSIMEYPFQPGLIVAPKPYDATGIGENLTLSTDDMTWVKAWYPAAAGAPAAIGAMQLQSLNATPGQQTDFRFVPDATREYTIATVGEADTRLVVFEERDDEPRHLVSGDDSGTESNVTLKAKLVKGRIYFIRARVNFSASPSGVGLIVY
jgi:hypothetical protein